jgi:4-diphosphocytidyl-2-C-methyl-D-erythritol kinase
LRVRAFAKINLSLRILGVRPDGYHALRTVFQSVALHDQLTLTRTRSRFVFTCDDPACPADSTNLVWRAAERVWSAAGRRGGPAGVRIHLIKRIPMKAGLGGGSSDAAATIRALGRLWQVDAQRLHDVARQLGADVPYFFEGGTVLGLDRGDRLFPLFDRPHAWVVLAVPPAGVSTAEAFGWFDSLHGSRLRARDRRRQAGRDEEGINDLEVVVSRRHREIAALVDSLRACGASPAAMSGSGSAVFGLFHSRSAALRAAKAVSARRAARVFVTRTIDRATYQRLACK